MFGKEEDRFSSKWSKYLTSSQMSCNDKHAFSNQTDSTMSTKRPQLSRREIQALAKDWGIKANLPVSLVL